MGSIPSNYALFMKKGTLVMHYITFMIKKNSKESLTTIFCTVIVYLYILFTEKSVCHDDTDTDSHRQSHPVTSEN